MMIQAITLLFVAATASTAMPIVNLWNAPASPNAGPAPLVVKRAETPAQIAQGSNYFFQSLSLESHCNHGEIGCVNGDMFARCSPEGNWELSPCPTNTICSAVPSTLMVAQIDVQCITQEQAQTAINEAGGEGNISQDFGITNAPVYALVDPSTLPSTTEAPTPTESEQPEDPNSTCIPDEEGGDDDEEGEVPSFTASLGEPVPTEIPTESAPVDPAATCTEEPEVVVTETITLILVPNPTVSGAFETSTLTGELPTATEFTEVPAETETASVSEVVTATSEAASVEPTETCSYSDEEPATEAPAETTSTEEAIQTTSASVPAEEQPASPTTLTIAPGATSVPVNAGTPPPSSSVDVNPLGNHFIPAAAPSQSPGVVRKRMEKKVKRS